MIYEKPKNEIFASDAKDGEIVEFPNVKRGWGVTENLGFIPPMEYFNAAFNRVDKSIAYQLQRGVGEWDKDLEYPIGAIVSLNGIVYVAKSQNTNKNPANEATIWGVFSTQEWSDSKFLKIGDYGLGGADNMPILNNLDDFTTKTGIYRTVEDRATGTPPATWSKIRHSSVIVERVDQNWIKQTMTYIDSENIPLVWYRTNKSNTVWHPWTCLNPLGVGQTWQEVTSHRLKGVTYTNTTGRPILVCATDYNGNGGGSSIIFIDGVDRGVIMGGNATQTSCTVLVPAGSTYGIKDNVPTPGSENFYRCHELR